jgi:tRNA U34 5-methylaminomethyl-2-thiouridine-forming methyltransferase MnmC
MIASFLDVFKAQKNPDLFQEKLKRITDKLYEA